MIISNQVWSGQLPKKKANILFFSFIYYPTSFLREKRFPTSQSLRNPTNLCISRINLSSSNKTKNELIISNQVWSGQLPQKNRHGKKGEKKNLSVYPCNMWWVLWSLCRTLWRCLQTSRQADQKSQVFTFIVHCVSIDFFRK